ncbi:MAG: peptidylprolyl isomerase [Nitrospirota bacterium]
MISFLSPSIHKDRLVYSVFLPAILVSLLVKANLSYGVTVDGVLATIGNEVITLSDYQQYVKSTGNAENIDEVDKELLKKLIEERIILNEAMKRGIEASNAEVEKRIEEFKNLNSLSQEDLEKALNESGMNISNYRKLMRDKMISLKLLDMEVDSKIILRDKEIEDFYIANKKDYLGHPEKVEIKAILLSLRENAYITEITDIKRKVLTIMGLLKEGEGFDSLVNRFSDEPLKSQGGRLGEFVRGELIPTLDQKAFSMKTGEISEPLWFDEGVYIIQLANRTEESFKSLEEVKEEIREHLYKQKREKIFNQWVSALWEGSHITLR